MFVVGLTGGIGSGKSTVAGMFAALEIDLIDADVAAREVVAPGTTALAEIVEHFGPDILMADGSLDRRGLRRIIFHQKQEKHWLETLLHPLIRRWLTQQIPTAEALIACLSLRFFWKPVKRKWLTVYWSSTSRSKRRSRALLPEMVEKKALSAQ